MLVFRNLYYYTVGEILMRARTARGRAAGKTPDATGPFEGFDAEEFPQLAAVQDRWAAVSAEDTFESGLRAFVAGLLDNPPAATS